MTNQSEQPTRELTPEQEIKSNKLSKRIKLMKGLEIACLSGMIVGTGVLFTGGLKENDKISYTGVGIYMVSLIGSSFSYNKKKYYKTDKHWLDHRVELDYAEDKKKGEKK